MSNYHVLKMEEKQNQVRVVFHITIPDETNFPGNSLRTCVYKYLGNTTINSVVPDLHTDFETEYNAMQTGEIVERVEIVKFNAYITNLQKRDAIDARYNSLTTEIVEYYRDILRFYLLDRNVPA